MGLQEGGQRAGIGDGLHGSEQVVEGIVARHLVPPALLFAHAQAQRCPLALGEAGDFAPEVEHVARAQEQAQGDQPEQGRERVAAAGGTAGVGHFPEGVPQALELGDCERTARAAAVARGGLTGGG